MFWAVKWHHVKALELLKGREREVILLPRPNRIDVRNDIMVLIVHNGGSFVQTAEPNRPEQLQF